RVFLRLVQPGEGAEDTKRRGGDPRVLSRHPPPAGEGKQVGGPPAPPPAAAVTPPGGGPAGRGGGGGARGPAPPRGAPAGTQLRGWIDAERAGLRTQRRLTEAAQEWAAAAPDQKQDYLYSGARLAVCREWAQTHRDELSPIEVAFLGVSEESERQQKQDALD